MGAKEGSRSAFGIEAEKGLREVVNLARLGLNRQAIDRESIAHYADYYTKIYYFNLT